MIVSWFLTFSILVAVDGRRILQNDPTLLRGVTKLDHIYHKQLRHRRSVDGKFNFPHSLKLDFELNGDKVRFYLKKRPFANIPHLMSGVDKITQNQIWEKHAMYQNPTVGATATMRCLEHTPESCEVYGTFHHKGKMYHIEPSGDGYDSPYEISEIDISGHFNRMREIEKLADKKISQSMQKGGDEVRTKSSQPANKNNVTSPLRHRRDTSLTQYTVELLFWIDYSLYSRFLAMAGNDAVQADADITTFCIGTMNDMDTRVRNYDAPMQAAHGVSFQCSAMLNVLFICKAPADCTWSSDNVVGGTLGRSSIENAFITALQVHTAEPFDMGIGLTAYDVLDNTHADLNGLLYYRDTMCSVNYANVVIIKVDRGGAGFNAAHFFDRLMGAYGDAADAGCTTSDNFIGANDWNTGNAAQQQNAFLYSECSLKRLDNALGSKTYSCLEQSAFSTDDFISYHNDSNRLGITFSKQQQCQVAYGEASAYCGTPGESECYDGLECTSPDTGTCDQYVLAFEGTDCRTTSNSYPNKYCSEGQCEIGATTTSTTTTSTTSTSTTTTSTTTTTTSTTSTTTTTTSTTSTTTTTTSTTSTTTTTTSTTSTTTTTTSTTSTTTTTTSTTSTTTTTTSTTSTTTTTTSTTSTTTTTTSTTSTTTTTTSTTSTTTTTTSTTSTTTTTTSTTSTSTTTTSTTSTTTTTTSTTSTTSTTTSTTSTTTTTTSTTSTTTTTTSTTSTTTTTTSTTSTTTTTTSTTSTSTTTTSTTTTTTSTTSTTTTTTSTTSTTTTTTSTTSTTTKTTSTTSTTTTTTSTTSTSTTTTSTTTTTTSTTSTTTTTTSTTSTTTTTTSTTSTTTTTTSTTSTTTTTTSTTSTTTTTTSTTSTTTTTTSTTSTTTTTTSTTSTTTTTTSTTSTSTTTTSTTTTTTSTTSTTTTTTSTTSTTTTTTSTTSTTTTTTSFTSTTTTTASTTSTPTMTPSTTSTTTTSTTTTTKLTTPYSTPSSSSTTTSSPSSIFRSRTNKNLFLLNTALSSRTIQYTPPNPSNGPLSLERQVAPRAPFLEHGSLRQQGNPSVYKHVSPIVGGHHAVPLSKNNNGEGKDRKLPIASLK